MIGDDMTNITASGASNQNQRVLDVGNQRRSAELAKRDGEVRTAYARYTANRAIGRDLQAERDRTSAVDGRHGLLVGLGVGAAAATGAALVAQRMGKLSPWVVGGGAAAVALSGFMGWAIGGLPKLPGGIPEISPTGPRIQQMEWDLGTLRDNAREPLSKHFPTAETMTGFGGATGLDNIVGNLFDSYDHDHDGRISLHGSPLTPADETVRFTGGGPVTNDRERTTTLASDAFNSIGAAVTGADTSGDGAIDPEELAVAITDLQAIHSKTDQSLAATAAGQRSGYGGFELEPEYVPSADRDARPRAFDRSTGTRPGDGRERRAGTGGTANGWRTEHRVPRT
jgi:hypothetical protein